MLPIVFMVACHPDDIEFRMAGTALLLGDKGCSLHYMNIANGSCGTASLSREEIIRVRREEAMESARLMGAVFCAPLVDDLDVYHDKATLAKLISVFREVNPDIMLVQSPQDYMEDHQNSVRLAVTAAFCRGMMNVTADPPTPCTYKDVAIYHSQPHGNRDAMRKLVRAESYVNIASVLERKRALLACHRSQKEWLDISQGFDSYLDSMTADSALTGKLSGKFGFAEGWRRHNPIGYCAPDYDPLPLLLGDDCWIDPAYESRLNE